MVYSLQLFFLCYFVMQICIIDFYKELWRQHKSKGIGSDCKWTAILLRILTDNNWICKRTDCRFQHGFYCQKSRRRNKSPRFSLFPIQNGGQTFKMAQQVFHGRIRVVGVIYIFSQWAPGASLLISGLIWPQTTRHANFGFENSFGAVESFWAVKLVVVKGLL